VRGFRAGMSPVRAGLVAILLIVIASYFAFSKDVPFTHTYRVQAVFENSNLVAPRAPVRIAGIDVGKVVAVGRYKDTKLAVITMEITDKGRPIHRDATIKIRPRLFLEGNFYLDLKPGTPSTDEIGDDGLIPVAQTSTPVQLDQILTALQTDTRASLQTTIKGLGEALDSKPTAADDADQDPLVQGLTGGQALNKGLDTSEGALRDSAIVEDALLGERPHDLSRLIKGLTRVTGGLARNENALRDFVTDFNTTVAATASRAPQLAQAVQLLGPTATNLKLGLDSLDRALPSTRAFAREILPGVRETPAAIAAAQAWLPQAAALFSQQELGGLLNDLGPATRAGAKLTRESLRFVPAIDNFSRCGNEVLIPASSQRIQDGDFTANTEVYKEFFSTMVGLAGQGQSFDGNGPMLRVSGAGGSIPVRSGQTQVDVEPAGLHANFTSPPQRTRPAYPANEPPVLRRDVACHRNALPDVNGPASTGPADGSKPGAPAPQLTPSPSAEAASLPSAAQVAANPGPSLVPLASVATEAGP
jgi:phospholipid/cholesterol/gamma-HCH transport system substrate-binding protein